MLRTRLCFAVLLVAVLAASPVWGGAAQTAVGDPFPDLVFPAIDGDNSVRLSDHRGQRVVLVEFASW